MRNTLETRLGIFVALAVLAAVLILETIGGFEQFQHGLRVQALFHNISDLKKGDRVKMAGVEIGRVKEINLTNNQVLVVMKLRKDVEVRTDSIASVKFTGLMGQNFVAIDFGSPTSPLADDDAMLKTTEQPELSEIIKKIDNVASGVGRLTDTFSGDTIQNLLGPMTDFIKANRAPLTATIANVQAISSQISSGKGTLGKLINDDALHNSALITVSNIQDAAADLKTTIADAHKAIDQVNSGQGTVGKLLHDEKLYAEATASMTNLKEILQKVNSGQGTVGKLVNDQEFYRNAKLTLQKIDKATEGLEDQGPLSVLSILVNNLF
jgi:phospholipid/cholesterol/gamma-HCH transport system substrate-binding protein